MVKKIYRKLTKDQKKRGVIFSSTLSRTTKENGGITHEVYRSDRNKEMQIKRLKNDSFFNASPYKYNIIRT